MHATAYVSRVNLSRNIVTCIMHSDHINSHYTLIATLHCNIPKRLKEQYRLHRAIRLHLYDYQL